MNLIKQKINWLAVIGQLGLLLHVPTGMATTTLIIALIFEEWFALVPFGTVAAFSLALGQLLYRLGKRSKASHLWDAMIIAGLGWLTCSLIAAIPFCWISHLQLQIGVESEVLQVFRNPSNAIFESISGFTSTGLTMMQSAGHLSHVLQWWRSLLEWTGGLGLVVFVLALTHLNKKGFQLYYAEARSEKMTKNIAGTAHWIWGIYSIFTGIAFLLFFIAGMPLWDAVNHAMTVISTGGFTITHTNFQGYDLTIQVIAMFMMLIGAISFAVHFRVIREKEYGILWKSWQHRLLYIFAIGGGLLILLLNWWNGLSKHKVDAFFEWISALTTCGYSSMRLSLMSPMVKLFLIMGMFVGGTTGSTAGGLKIRRLIYLVSGIVLRILAITSKNEKHITGGFKENTSPPNQEPPGIVLPHTQTSERLFTAGILFSLWTSTLFLGWFLILKWVPKGSGLDALFEVTSAMSNVGLSSGIVHPDLPTAGKWIFMALMWMGRLEIIPALILILTLPMIFTRSSKNGNQS
ncbi:TrkH family potassium uptake protein [Candidatus Neptunichlamydia sp. REUL1]|uniref:TrkH family potassium uptake protein n=1 Tax=Candidatus Neptunichlamydia sp. REUL1 TaxID=3064277 RepID=UPI00293087D6|nr:potassium transporter TrkG [Candidatus Neptunochlamydia sp. REUL1]